MRPFGVAVLLCAVFLLLLPIARGDDTLPTDLRIVGNDVYAEQVPVAGTASFAWGIVNVDGAPYDLMISGNITSPDYLLSVSPANVTLGPGEVVTVYANVTVPGSPQAPQATVDVVVRLQDGRHAHLSASVQAREPVRFVDLLTAFLAVGAIIFVGFFASLVFERTKIPDLIWLIVLGLILGPILTTFFGISLIPLNLLRLVTPYFAALALMIILFDGGLNLRLRQVVSQAGVSVLHTAITWLGALFAITLIAMTLLGYPLWIGVLLGTVLGGTSSAVVIGVVRGMSIQEDSRTILVLESTITDVLCIIGALTVISILRGGGTLTGTIGGIAAAFLVALGLGVLAGLLWLRVLSGMQGKPFGFMITIAALFLLYAGTEFLGGSGGMAALVFGLVLGNHRQIAKVLKVKEPFRVDDSFKQFHSEISFVIRTFFFVFLGFSFTLPFTVEWAVQSPLPGFSLLNNTFWLVLVAIILIFIGIWGTRVLAAAATTRVRPDTAEDRKALTVVMGRGLAAAVLASLPFAIPAFTDPANPEYASYHNAMVGYETPFLTIAFLIILMTVTATTVGVVAFERRHKPAGFVETATASLSKEMTATMADARRELERTERERERRRQRELHEIERNAKRLGKP